MSESDTHRKLVNLIYEYTESTIPKGYPQLIYCDSSDKERPCCVVDNFVPDVLYQYKNILIIGEAKSYNDFERKHSKEQFEAYMKECAMFNGDKTLIIGIPWELTITAKNYFRKLKRSLNLDTVKVIILNEMGGVFSV